MQKEAHASPLPHSGTVARVALDVPLDRLFDYLNPVEADIGDRVLVPFGRKRCVGLVVELADEGETRIPRARLRAIESVLDDCPPLPRDWIEFCRFTADYYQRPLGEVIHAALPPRLKRDARLPADSQLLKLGPGGEAALASLPTRNVLQRRVLTTLHRGPCPDHALLHEQGVSRLQLRRMRDAGWITVADPVLGAADTPDSPAGTAAQFVAAHELNTGQHDALQAIRSQSGFGVFLLFGVTGSGKTEVYLNAVAETLSAGRQALLLVPEIGLTPAVADAVRTRFPGARFVVQHSGLPDAERARGFRAALEGRADILLGTRLAALAPLPRLGLVVVDEEQDGSFKQQDGIRYSARDLAIMRAHRAGVPAVLASATPSLESYRHATEGRYRLLRLAQRAHADARLPALRLIDTREHAPRDGLTAPLESALAHRLDRDEQSLIFLNRRGYAPALACHPCGWVAGCPRCSVRLVVHLGERRLRCHHCGVSEPIPRACPECGNLDLAPLGRGTQRIETVLAARYPGATILRFDSDSAARDPGALLARARNADILVGTQMLAKGHHFERVTLVGVLDADAGLFAADYRAPERLFAQLAQVSGRAGRADLPGEVMIQTRYPHHPLYAALLRHDYDGYATTLLEERRQSGFPPFVHEAALRADAPSMNEAIRFLQQALALAPDPGPVTLYDPSPQTLARLAGRERAQLIAQSPSRPALQRFLSLWRTVLPPTTSRLRWHVDVDPTEF